MKGGKAKRTRKEMAHTPPSCPVEDVVGLTEEGSRVVKQMIKSQINSTSFQMITDNVPEWTNVIASMFQSPEDSEESWLTVWERAKKPIQYLLYGRDMPIPITPGLLNDLTKLNPKSSAHEVRYDGIMFHAALHTDLGTPLTIGNVLKLLEPARDRMPCIMSRTGQCAVKKLPRMPNTDDPPIPAGMKDDMDACVACKIYLVTLVYYEFHNRRHECLEVLNDFCVCAGSEPFEFPPNCLLSQTTGSGEYVRKSGICGAFPNFDFLPIVWNGRSFVVRQMDF